MYLKKSSGSIVFVLVSAVIISSCGTMNSETVVLSNAITDRIKDMERSHIQAVNLVFDAEKQRVDKFMNEKWIPLFLKNFLGTSMILRDLTKIDSIGAGTYENIKIAASEYLTDESESDEIAKKIVDTLNSKRENEEGAVQDIVKSYVPNDKVDAASIHINALLNLETPAVLVMEFAQAANDEIKKQRESLLAPIEEARRNTLDAINQDYVDIYAGQGVITARLEAAVRKDQVQARLIDAVGGEGAAREINTRLLKFSNDMKGIFSSIGDLQKELESFEGTSGDASADLMKYLHEKIQEALKASGLIDD